MPVEPPHFIQAHGASTILKRSRDAKDAILIGLAAVRVNNLGWRDPTSEVAQPLWTNVNVATCLLETDNYVPNLEGVLKLVDNGRLGSAPYDGWPSEYVAGATSTYVTADVAKLFLASGDFGRARTAVKALCACQNTDGGWGVVKGDTASKVRPTSLAIRVLAKSWHHSLVSEDIDPIVFESALKWLIQAHNDSDGGWANVPSTINSNVSATADALDALATTLVALRFRPLANISVRQSVIQRGILFLISAAREGSWNGPPEECPVIDMNGRTISHVVSGIGPTVICAAIARLARIGFVEPNHDLLIGAIETLLSRCKSIPNYQGKWLVPSDQGSTPTTWNSAFAVGALSEVELLIHHLQYGQVIESPIITAVTRPLLLWKAISLVLATILLAAFVVASGVLQNISVWFGGLSALTQGLMLTVTGLILEAVVVAVPTIWRSVRMFYSTTGRGNNE